MIGLMTLSLSSFAQIKGKIVDQTTKEVLANASITSEKGENITSGLDGSFELKTTKKGEIISISYVGFKTAKVEAQDGMTIELESTSIGLKEVAVFANLGIDRSIYVQF